MLPSLRTSAYAFSESRSTAPSDLGRTSMFLGQPVSRIPPFQSNRLLLVELQKRMKGRQANSGSTPVYAALHLGRNLMANLCENKCGRVRLGNLRKSPSCSPGACSHRRAQAITTQLGKCMHVLHLSRLPINGPTCTD